MIPINKLLLFFAFVGPLGCEPDDKFTGVAAGAKGLYLVTTYIVSGDTLFSLVPGSTGYTSKINRIGVDNFTIAIDVIESDQLTVRTDYWRKGVRSTFSKEVAVRLTNYDYQFSLVKTNAASDYEGSVGRFSGFFYERTVGGGVLISPADSQTKPVFLTGCYHHRTTSEMTHELTIFKKRLGRCRLCLYLYLPNITLLKVEAD